MDESVVLILLAFIMLIGSYLAGSIPLIVSMSEKKLKVVTVFGAGLLVGTALTVIIPEGINALYSDVLAHNHNHHQHQPHHEPLHNKLPSDNGLSTSEPLSSDHHSDSDEHDEPVEHSATIGLALVLGFVFMMLVDQISHRSNENITSQSDRNSTATIGLVVHAAADGIALGAAATTSHKDVEMIVFLAIMLHKAPAAFGLVSFLLHEGIDRKRIRKHLVIFSLAAPLLTLITFFGIGQEQKETLNSVNATGIAMLFSAGTFLYVATVHVLPELTSNPAGGGGGHHGQVMYNHLEQPMITQAPKGYAGLRNIELAILIAGALTPLLLTIGHHH